MLGHMISLFRARKDPALAKTIASEMIVDGAIDRASWPLWIAKFWMVAAILMLAGLAVLFLWIGFVTHWSLAIPSLLFGGLIYGVIRIWLGIDKGVEIVATLAKAELGKQAAKLQLPTPKQGPEF